MSDTRPAKRRKLNDDTGEHAEHKARNEKEKDENENKKVKKEKKKKKKSKKQKSAEQAEESHEATQDAYDDTQNAMETSDVGDAVDAGQDNISPTNSTQTNPPPASKPDQYANAPAWMANGKTISSDSRIKLTDVAKFGVLHKVILANLQSMGLSELFPVQVEVIPYILRGTVTGGDVLVCAPTGSGKTLAYAIPIVNTLIGRLVKRLRALVLVPTRELAAQVTAVFKQLIKGTGLVVESLYGDKPFWEEQKRIVNMSECGLPLQEGSSLVDIIIATPGRLVEHLQETPGFTLQHLRFLVADEADRLLMQSYQDWLNKVLAAVHSVPEGRLIYSDGSAVIDAATQRVVQPVCAKQMENLSMPPLQKLLFSATLTQNPKKIASLKLVNPKFFTAVTTQEHQYRIPESVKQHVVVCSEDIKPLVLMTLLLELQTNQVLVFTKSLETTHRLAVLLKLLADAMGVHLPVIEYSAQLSQQEREKLIKDFKSGSLSVIVCSDVMARGLDIHDVGAVVNYDTPQYIKTYVHRVGRTGRAGRAGKAFTIARKEEMRHFKQMLQKAENTKQLKYKIDFDRIKSLEPHYKEALKALKLTLERETQHSVGSASTTDAMIGNTPLYSESASDIETIRRLLKQQAEINWFSRHKQGLDEENLEESDEAGSFSDSESSSSSSSSSAERDEE